MIFIYSLKTKHKIFYCEANDDIQLGFYNEKREFFYQMLGPGHFEPKFDIGDIIPLETVKRVHTIYLEKDGNITYGLYENDKSDFENKFVQYLDERNILKRLDVNVMAGARDD